MTDKLNLNWEEVIKKEARGVNDADLGEVQELGEDYVITEKGLVDKKRYLLPKSRVSHFDGHNLVFNITEEEAAQYIR